MNFGAMSVKQMRFKLPSLIYIILLGSLTIIIGYDSGPGDSQVASLRVIGDSSVVTDKSGKQPLVTSHEDPAKTSIVSVQHPKFEEYANKTPTEVLDGLWTDIEVWEDKTALLLQLIEAGHLNINQPMRKGENSHHYTPLFAAIVASYDKITAHEFDQFIRLGATIAPNNVGLNRSLVAGLRTNDIKVQQRLMELSGLGPEDHQALFNYSLWSGDGALANYLNQHNNGQFRFSESDLNKSLRRLELATRPFREDEDSAGGKSIKKGMFVLNQVSSEIARVELALSRSINFEKLSYLTFEQRQQLPEFIIALEFKHQRLLEKQQQLVKKLKEEKG